MATFQMKVTVVIAHSGTCSLSLKRIDHQLAQARLRCCSGVGAPAAVSVVCIDGLSSGPRMQGLWRRSGAPAMDLRQATPARRQSPAPRRRKTAPTTGADNQRADEGG
jgi:hypothetical protein